MLYVPGLFSFVHVPRTGGNAITRTLVRHLIDTADVVCSMDHNRTLWRHMPAGALVAAIPRAASTPIFAIDRDMEDIIYSDWRLHLTVPPVAKPAHDFEHRVAAAHDSLDAFRAFWFRFLGGKTPTRYWCEGANVATLPYNDMAASWAIICKAAGLHGVPLPRVDYQKDRFLEGPP